MKLHVVKVDSVGDHGIQIVGRTPSGERRKLVVPDFYPYFYIPENEVGETQTWSRRHKTDDGNWISESPVRQLPTTPHRAMEDGTSVQKVVLKNVRDVKKFRENVTRVWEADIPYTQRFIVDTDCIGTIEVPDPPSGAMGTLHTVPHQDIKKVDDGYGKPRIQYVDIEVAADHFEHPQDAGEPVCSISLYDNHTDTMYSWAWNPKREASSKTTEMYSRALKRFIPWKIWWCDSDRELLSKFMQWQNRNRADAMVGWNYIDYDMQYMYNRFKQVGVRTDWHEGHYTDIPETQLVDLMELYKGQNMGELASVSLGVVAQTECGIELVKEADNILKWFKEDPEALLNYNALDVDATIAIDQKVGLMEYAYRYATFTKVDNIMDITKASIVVDVAHLIEANTTGQVLPSRFNMEVNEGYEGAIVMEPDAGLHEFAAVIDFSQMYPTIMRLFNMSYETYGKPGYTLSNGVTFSKEEGLTPRVCRKMAETRGYYDRKIKTAKDNEERKHWKAMRTPVKNTYNGIYGVAAYPKFRLFHAGVAESVTYVGRELIGGVRDFAKMLGIRVIYGDTDSLVVVGHFKDLSESVDGFKDLTRRINFYLQDYCKKHGAAEDILKVELEKIYDKLLLTRAKKRYAGRVVWEDDKQLPEPYLDIKGFEFRRSESPEIAGDLQFDIIGMIFNGDSRDDVKSYLDGLTSEVEKGLRSPLEVSMRPKLSKDPEKYNSGFMAAKAALYSKEHLGVSFRGGDRVYCLYVKSVRPGCPLTHVIGLSETKHKIPDGFIPDWKKMADKCIRDKTKRILEAMGWDQVGKQVSLTGF